MIQSPLYRIEGDVHNCKDEWIVKIFVNDVCQLWIDLRMLAVGSDPPKKEKVQGSSKAGVYVA